MFRRIKSFRKYREISKLLSTNVLRVSEEVEWAICNRKPVVALESTIITHGMPFPENLKIAKEVESMVRQQGCIPATVAILKGSLRVGLGESELNELADSRNKPIKVSRRDMPFVLSQGLSGGTTVSATMISANLVGIPVFATGGIGGVHKGGEISMDVSADLTELGRTPIAVICAGVKSILDIGRTLEYLETQGVAVAVLGDDNEFPAFFTPKSGFRAPAHLTDVGQAARLIESRDSLKLSSGILVAVPIPSANREQGDLIEEAIREALDRARSEGITGKNVTPYVLSMVNKLTRGTSLQLNRILVLNNARVAGQIAVELSQISSTSGTQNGSSSSGTGKTARKRESPVEGRPVVVGASNIDIVSTLDHPTQGMAKASNFKVILVHSSRECLGDHLCSINEATSLKGIKKRNSILPWMFIFRVSIL